MNPFILNFTSYNTSYHKLCENRGPEQGIGKEVPVCFRCR